MSSTTAEPSANGRHQHDPARPATVSELNGTAKQLADKLTAAAGSMSAEAEQLEGAAADYAEAAARLLAAFETAAACVGAYATELGAAATACVQTVGPHAAAFPPAWGAALLAARAARQQEAEAPESKRERPEADAPPGRTRVMHCGTCGYADDVPACITDQPVCPRCMVTGRGLIDLLEGAPPEPVQQQNGRPRARRKGG